MCLKNALRAASYKVWEEMNELGLDSSHEIFQVREEGLTSMALKEISRTGCPHIARIKMIGAKIEKIRGYGFELCIGNKKTKEYIRYFIQSKKLYGHDLDSDYGSIDSIQIQNLENFSKAHNSLPLFALYNHLYAEDVSLINYHNSVFDFYDKKSLGITITTPSKLRTASTFKEIHYSPISDYIKYPFLRYHPMDARYLLNSNIQAAVPFHELANFRIDLAKEINALYKKKQQNDKVGFFFFFGMEKYFLSDDDNLIPILKDQTPDSLVGSFLQRADQKLSLSIEDGFNPQAIIVVHEE